MQDKDQEITTEKAPVYELAYLVLPSIPEDKLPQLVDSIKKVVAKDGGKEIDSEDPILHPLAYDMSKTIGASRYVLSDAYIGWIKFEGDASKIGDIKIAVEKMDEVLRSLIVKAPRKTTFTFAQARAKALEKERAENEKHSEVAAAPEETVVAAPAPIEE
jgi:ribosomal protein S6